MKINQLILWLHDAKAKLKRKYSNEIASIINSQKKNENLHKEHEQTKRSLQIMNKLLSKLEKINLASSKSEQKIAEILKQNLYEIMQYDSKEKLGIKEFLLQLNDLDSLRDDINQLPLDDKKSVFKAPKTFVEQLKLFKDKLFLKDMGDGRVFNDLPTPEFYLNKWLKLCENALDEIAQNPQAIDVQVNYLMKLIDERIQNDLFDNNMLKKEIYDVFKDKGIETNDQLENDIVLSYKVYLNMILNGIMVIKPGLYQTFNVDDFEQPLNGLIVTKLERNLQKTNLAKKEKPNETSSSLSSTQAVPFGKRKNQSSDEHHDNIKLNFYKILIKNKYLKSDNKLDETRIKGFIDDLIDKYNFKPGEIKQLFTKIPQLDQQQVLSLFTNDEQIKHRDTSNIDVEYYKEAVAEVARLLENNPNTRATGMKEIRDILAYYNKSEPNKNAYHIWLNILKVAKKREREGSLLSTLFRNKTAQQFYNTITNYEIEHPKNQESKIDVKAPIEENNASPYDKIKPWLLQGFQFNHIENRQKWINVIEWFIENNNELKNEKVVLQRLKDNGLAVIAEAPVTPTVAILKSQLNYLKSIVDYQGIAQLTNPIADRNFKEVCDALTRYGYQVIRQQEKNTQQAPNEIAIKPIDTSTKESGIFSQLKKVLNEIFVLLGVKSANKNITIQNKPPSMSSHRTTSSTVRFNQKLQQNGNTSNNISRNTTDHGEMEHLYQKTSKDIDMIYMKLSSILDKNDNSQNAIEEIKTFLHKEKTKIDNLKDNVSSKSKHITLFKPLETKIDEAVKLVDGLEFKLKK